MAQFASAAFTGTDGTELSVADANWTKHGFGDGDDFLIITNRVRTASAGSTRVSQYYHSGTPASADYSVTADLYIVDANGGDNGCSVAARLDTAAYTFYFGRYNGAVGSWQMFKWVAGSATQLGSSVAESLSAATTHEVKLECIGTAIKLYKQGGATATISVTDSSITAAGKAGLYIRGTGSTTAGIHLDNFSADDISSGVTGTIAVTLASFTSSITGTTTVVGTTAATMAAFTSAITGTSEVPGTIAATTEAAVGALEGTAGTDGTITGLVEDSMASMAGSTSIVGTMNVTLEENTSSITGTTTVVGQMAASVAGFVSSIYGTSGLQTAINRLLALIGVGK